MSKILVLAEKPSVGRDIARVLGCHNKSRTSIEGSKYIVTWALGHLVTLADPVKYDKKYENWKLEDLPMLPEKMQTEIIAKTSSQYSAVKKLMTRGDVSSIVIATDAGREGELVARWIIDKAKIKKPIKRLWISSVTDKAIREGFNNLKDGKAYYNLYQSAVARAEADWIVGINATRALTCKFNAQLSCGRVQTPTIAMLNEREEAIMKFKPKEYYGIQLKSDNIEFVWKNRNNQTRMFDGEFTDTLIKKLENTVPKNVRVSSVVKNKKKKHAPGLYNLTDLQKDANKRYGYSAKETLQIMQGLYEKHKVLTYPRTDSKFISTDIVPTLKDRIRSCSVGEYRSKCAPLLRQNIRGNNSFVDDKKVTDHHAIIPTEESPNFRDFHDTEYKIYDMVIKRFLGVLYPAYEYEQINIEAQFCGEKFIAKGKVVINPGWKDLYGHSYEEESEVHDEEVIKEQIIPSVKQGDSFAIKNINKTIGRTKPPGYFTEGTLVAAMEDPAKYTDILNKNVSKILTQTGGIGTVATRADIIEKLFSSFLMEKRGKEVHITSKGKQLLKIVPEDLKTPALTAEWETKLLAIASGQLKLNDFVKEMKDYTKIIVRDIKNSDATFKHDNLSREKCPDCGKYLLDVNGKKGRMLICQDRECGFRKGLAKVTNARCPQCHKKLELRGEGDGKIFVCKCGFREKLSAFEKRKSESSSNSKRDYQNYLKEQKTKEVKKVEDSPFAAALMGLKLDK